jgi:muconate cycloisomerase
LLVDVPRIRPHLSSMATMQRQTIVLVRSRCSDGIIGPGEGTTIGGLAYGEESPKGIKLALDPDFVPVGQVANSWKPHARGTLTKGLHG